MTLFKPKTKEEIKEYIDLNNDLSPDDLLLGASKVGSLEYVQKAINNHADIHIQSDLPLRTATYYGHTNIVEFLLEKGANVHAFSDDTLRWALIDENIDLLKILKKYTRIPVWKTYRLLRRFVNRKLVNDISVETLSEEWHTTIIKFRARNKKEAMKKANKFWRDGEFGAGSITVALDGFYIDTNE